MRLLRDQGQSFSGCGRLNEAPERLVPARRPWKNAGMRRLREFREARVFDKRSLPQ